MPYKEALKNVFAETGVQRVAIVDDAFDPIAFDQIDRNAIAAVRTELLELDEGRDERRELAEHVEAISGLSLADIAKRLTEQIERLWDVYSAAAPGSDVATLFSPLFGAIGTTRREKLRPLRALRSILEAIDNVQVDEFGSDTTPDKLEHHELIFLDYYLEADVPEKGQGKDKAAEQAGRERSIKFLSDLVELRQDNLPLVMLISSLASPKDLVEFRRDARMLASKMNFLQKTFAETDPAQAQHSIMALVRHTKQADALATLLKTWHAAVQKASEEMMVSIRELDLMDYSYIQHYRLAGEKTPLGQYIAWLFNGRLTDLVETELRKQKVDALVSDFTLPEAIPGRASPTTAITDLVGYNDPHPDRA
jgi:hypothetical protein